MFLRISLYSSVNCRKNRLAKLPSVQLNSHVINSVESKKWCLMFSCCHLVTSFEWGDEITEMMKQIFLLYAYCLLVFNQYFLSEMKVVEDKKEICMNVWNSNRRTKGTCFFTLYGSSMLSAWAIKLCTVIATIPQPCSGMSLIYSTSDS